MEFESRLIFGTKKPNPIAPRVIVAIAEAPAHLEEDQILPAVGPPTLP